MKVFPCPIDPQILEPLLKDLPQGFFTAEFSQICEEVDGFVGDCLFWLVGELDLFDFHGDPSSLPLWDGTAYTCERLRWLFECFLLYGLGEKEGNSFALRVQPPVPDLDRRFQQRVARAPGARPALAVQQLATSQFTSVLRRETTGEAALFSLANFDLWFRYFSNENPYYAPSNRLAALSLARAVRPAAKILELGGGAGSAAEAAFAALTHSGKPPARYVFTELQPAFLRRGLRLLHQRAPQTCQVEARPFDINLPLEVQSFEERNFDAIYAVNVLHLARDLSATLTSLRSLLKPGGVLVLGELLRPTPQAPVPIELPFLLLESYLAAGATDRRRLRPGFLAYTQWRQALEEAGFSPVQLLPQQLAACQKHYPGFSCAALTAWA